MFTTRPQKKAYKNINAEGDRQENCFALYEPSSGSKARVSYPRDNTLHGGDSGISPLQIYTISTSFLTNYSSQIHLESHYVLKLLNKANVLDYF